MVFKSGRFSVVALVILVVFAVGACGGSATSDPASLTEKAVDAAIASDIQGIRSLVSPDLQGDIQSWSNVYGSDPPGGLMGCKGVKRQTLVRDSAAYPRLKQVTVVFDSPCADLGPGAPASQVKAFLEQVDDRWYIVPISGALSIHQ